MFVGDQVKQCAGIMLIRVTQIDYYLNKHMEIVKRHWTPYGMKSCVIDGRQAFKSTLANSNVLHRWTIVQFEEGDPSGMNVQAIMLWESVEAFEKAIEANIPEVMEDLKYYSSEKPVRYYAKVLQQG